MHVFVFCSFLNIVARKWYFYFVAHSIPKYLLWFFGDFCSILHVKPPNWHSELFWCQDSQEQWERRKVENVPPELFDLFNHNCDQYFETFWNNYMGCRDQFWCHFRNNCKHKIQWKTTWNGWSCPIVIYSKSHIPTKLCLKGSLHTLSVTIFNFKFYHI